MTPRDPRNTMTALLDTAPALSAAELAAVRADFPLLTRTLRAGRPLVYLDSGATSQKPDVVINAEMEFYRERNAAVHRGVAFAVELHLGVDHDVGLLRGRPGVQVHQWPTGPESAREQREVRAHGRELGLAQHGGDVQKGGHGVPQV